MLRLISFILFSLLLLNTQAFCAQTDENQTRAVDKKVYTEEDFNFNDNSYYISDEQLKDAESIDQIEDRNSSFWSKIINSSHFSSGTATKTYIPINKVQ